MVALGADRAELLIGAAGKEGELVAGSSPSANRTSRYRCHRSSLRLISNNASVVRKIDYLVDFSYHDRTNSVQLGVGQIPEIQEEILDLGRSNQLPT
jgi:hypothetical protein